MTARLGADFVKKTKHVCLFAWPAGSPPCGCSGCPANQRVVLDRHPLHSLTPFYIAPHGTRSPPCTFGGCSENQRVDCFLFVCKTSSRYPASVHVALKFDTSMLHDEMLSLCAFCIQCFVNIFVPIKIQRVSGFQSIDACVVDAGCRSRAIGHSACILCSVIRMKFQCDRALGMHVFHAFNLHDEYMFIQYSPWIVPRHAGAAACRPHAIEHSACICCPVRRLPS